MEDGKMSVQKRIQELERIAGGKPVRFRSHEELQRSPSGRSAQFRSQSLNLPRPTAVSVAGHYEAEGLKGSKLPLYKAPFEGSKIPELGSSDSVRKLQEAELLQESVKSGVSAPVESKLPAASGAHCSTVPDPKERRAKSETISGLPAAPAADSRTAPEPKEGRAKSATANGLATAPTAHDCSLPEPREGREKSETVRPLPDQASHKAETFLDVVTSAETSKTVTPSLAAHGTRVLEPHEGLAKSETVRSLSIQASDNAERLQDVGTSFEIPKTATTAPDIMANSKHVKNEPVDSSSPNSVESMAKFEIFPDFEAHSTVDEKQVVEPGKEDLKSKSSLEVEGRLGSGLGEAYVIVSGDGVPQESPLFSKDLGASPSANLSREVGDMSEAAKGPNMDSSFVAVEKNTTPNTFAKIGDMPKASMEPEMDYSSVARKTSILPDATTGMVPAAGTTSTFHEVPSGEASMSERPLRSHETSLLLSERPAVDLLFIDAQQDRLWEMHSRELYMVDSPVQELSRNFAKDAVLRHYANGTPPYAEVVAGDNGNGIDKSSKSDEPQTPLKTLLDEEDSAEKGPSPGSGTHGASPHNQSVSPRGTLFKRFVSSGKEPQTKQTSPSKPSPKAQTAAKAFFAFCSCFSVK